MTPIRSLAWLSAAPMALVMAMPAHGQDRPDGPPNADRAEETPARDDDFHADEGGIVVTATRAGVQRDFLSGVAQIGGAELTQALRPTLGDTLTKAPGVSATSFGPNASRPVLRGLQGERVRVLTDGIGAIDVSNTSADHAVVVDPLLAERVEILRGPQALLYDGAAVGGIVNVIDKRIPRKVPDEPVHLDVLAGYGSAADERSIAAAADVPVGRRFVLHADGSYLKTDDLSIGGYALSPAARREALASAALPRDASDPDAIDFAANAAISGTLPNSAAETKAAGVGAAFIDARGNLGIAYSHYESLYGVPVRFATQPGQAQEAPRLSLTQDRIDARAGIAIGGDVLDAIDLRYAYADYRHFELEEDGAVGTAFYNRGMEGRVELHQAQHGGWTGTSGAQFFTRGFDVVGEEAFLPRNDTRQLALFSVQQFDLAPLRLELGARFEHAALQASPADDQPQFFAGERRFDTLSGALGASYALDSDWRIGLNLARTARAPSAEELFANGPHAGTESFEVGDPDLVTERSWGVEALLRGGTGRYHVELSAYHSWFSDFVYQARTGGNRDGLPVFAYRQADARLYGFEAQGSATIARLGETELAADALVDMVRSTIDGAGPAPRIPPLRVLAGLGATSPRLDARGEVEWVAAQTRTAAFETPTDGYTLVNLSLDWRPWGRQRPFALALSANNLFDVTARRHASFLKDFAPLAGRDIRVSVRIDL